MCWKCDGWSDEDIRQWYLETIQEVGWALCGVERGPNSPPFSYTVGLTRFHDHPELVMSGLDGPDAQPLLNELAAHVREGHRYRAGDVITSFSSHRYQVLRVNDPRRLAMAQEIYGLRGARPVHGLQVVWSNHAGQWPWDPAWADGRRTQQIFGKPLRAGA